METKRFYAWRIHMVKRMGKRNGHLLNRLAHLTTISLDNLYVSQSETSGRRLVDNAQSSFVSNLSVFPLDCDAVHPGEAVNYCTNGVPAESTRGPSRRLSRSQGPDKGSDSCQQAAFAGIETTICKPGTAQ